MWLTDHTNQIGRENVLAVLRVRNSQLPRPGVSLRHQDVEVLALVPGEEWKREHVAKVYQETAEHAVIPAPLVRTEPRNCESPPKPWENRGTGPLVIRDPKHFLANQLEALLKQDPQYEAFAKQLSGTRPALQQTKFAHFIPPGFKMKCAL